MVKKKSGDVLTPGQNECEERDYATLIKESSFGHLDDYFKMMMSAGQIAGEEKDICELAVRAFINDISHNGLPLIRRKRYNRELSVSAFILGLRGKLEEMMNKDPEEYSP